MRYNEPLRAKRYDSGCIATERAQDGPARYNGCVLINKIIYLMKNWKLGLHLILRTKRFGVDNKWWYHFDDTTFGVDTKQIIWDVIHIYPLFTNYKLMKIRASA